MCVLAILKLRNLENLPDMSLGTYWPAAGCAKRIFTRSAKRWWASS